MSLRQYIQPLSRPRGWRTARRSKTNTTATALALARGEVLIVTTKKKLLRPLALLLQRLPAATAALLLWFGAAGAGELGKRDGWWGAGEFGGGSVTLSGPTDELDDSFAGFYLGLAVGYALTPHVLIGVETNGWLREASDPNNPTKGEAVNPVFGVLRFYPFEDTGGLYLKAGGGLVDHWNNDWKASEGNGWGIMGGVGYDIHVEGPFFLSPFFTYTYGKLKYDNLPQASDDEGDFHAITVGVGVVMY